MKVTRKHIVVLAVGAAVAAGSGAALAVDRSPRAPDREAFLAGVAERLGVSADDLRAALKAERAERAPRPDGRGPGRARHGRGPAAGFLEAASEYLGLERAELRERLRGGSSLADVARAEGKSVDGLKGALRAAFLERLDARLDTLVEQRFRPRR